MAKALRTAATIVGAAALVVGGIATANPSLVIAGAKIGTIAAITSAAAVALNVGANLLAKKPTAPGASVGGVQTQFSSNLDQGLPYAMGRTAVAGWNVHDVTYDAGGSVNNGLQTFIGVWSSGGPIQEFEAFQVDKATVSFGVEPGGSVADSAQGGFHSWMWLRHQLGNGLEDAALTATGFAPYPPGWSAAAKLSGHAAYAWTLRFDDTGATYPGGTIPQPRAIVKGVKVYDPRQDSTYPGGDGPCRAGDESTYVWEGVDPAHPAGKNPFLHGLTWALGRFQNGKRVLGIGMTLAALDVPAFAHGANVADANGWEIAGVAYSTDGKLEVLRKMLAAGSGAPLQLGGMLSCEVDAPRVSLATITNADIIGDASVVSTPTTSERINGIIPSCRLEDHDWQIVPCAKVAIEDYIAVDGKSRTKAATWEFVGSAAQVAQLAAYSIVNAREFGPIVTPLKLRWIGYRPGDALTINSNDLGQQNQLVVIQHRHLDPQTAAVTLTMRSETTGKHDFALGKTTTPPPTPSLALVDRGHLLQPGLDAAWPRIADPDGTRPDDNATNSANPASPFGPSATVADALADIAAATGDATAAAQHAAELQDQADALAAQSRESVIAALQSQLVADAARLRAEASALIAGQKVSLVLRRETITRQDGLATVQEQINLLGVVDETGKSFVIDMDRVMVSPTQSLAGRLTQLTAELTGEIDTKASTTQLDQAVADASSANATALQQVVAELSGQIEGKASATSLAQAIVDQQRSLAQSVHELQADYNAKFDGKASLIYVNQVTADVASASATALQQAVAQIDQSKATKTELSEAVASEAEARSSQLDTRAAQLQGAIDQKASETALQEVRTELGGKTSASDFHQLEATVGQVDGRVTTLREVVIDHDGNVTAKAMLQLDANGRAVGAYATNDGSTGDIVFLFDHFTLLRPGSSTPLLYNDGGTLKLPDVEIDRLRTNTAIVPGYGVMSGPIVGDGGPSPSAGGGIFRGGVS